MLHRLVSVEAPAGQTLLREGEAGDCCYFLKSGRAQVLKAEGSGEQLLAELETGACFGEEALLEDRPRNASVAMIEDGSVLRWPGRLFRIAQGAGGERGRSGRSGRSARLRRSVAGRSARR